MVLFGSSKTRHLINENIQYKSINKKQEPGTLSDMFLVLFWVFRFWVGFLVFGFWPFWGFRVSDEKLDLGMFPLIANPAP